MGQIFQRRSNTVARASILAFVFLIILCGWGLHAVFWSPFTTQVGVPLEQPVPFSHQHHVGGLGIDCRYCHSSVETSAFAGMPQTETCMTCHSRVWPDAPMLEPVRQSLATQTPLQWNRVHDLPDFVFFNHSIHVNKGIGCSTCHGEVDRMPLTWKENTLYMKWCLDCHRKPERFLRPKDQVFNLHWEAPVDQKTEGRKLAVARHINGTQLTDCSMCHR